MADTGSETFTAARGSGITGAACPVSGPYRSNRNSKIVVFFLKGDKFPADSDGEKTTWTLVSESLERAES
jgi:hypothetical protein